MLIGISIVLALIILIYIRKLTKYHKASLHLLNELKKDVDNIKNDVQPLKTNQNNELLDEKRNHLFLLAYRVRDTVHKQQSSIHARLIQDTPHTHGYTESELASFLSPQALLAVKQFWSLYNEYLTEHWLDSQNRYKTIFKGTEQDPYSELGQMKIASKRLLLKLDSLIEQMKSA